MAGNIGPKQRTLRMLAGGGAFLVAISAALLLWRSGVDRAWRAVLFVPLWMAALGVVEAKDGT